MKEYQSPIGPEWVADVQAANERSKQFTRQINAISYTAIAISIASIFVTILTVFFL